MGNSPTTDTSNRHVAVFPVRSENTYTTGVVPTGKKLPGTTKGDSMMKVGPESSVANGGTQDTIANEPNDKRTVISSGQP